MLCLSKIGNLKLVWQPLLYVYLPLGVQPTVVYDDRVVSHIPVSASDKHVRHLLEQVLADAELGVVVAVRVAPEPLPRQPSHGGSPRQAIVKTSGNGF